MTAPGTFSVKNFEKFQHYKDRSPPWIRLYNSLLDDYDYGRLPDASKAHLNAIWLLASRYDNKIPYDPVWVARRINATDPVDLALLAKAGFIILDQGCSNSLAERKQVAMPEERRAEAETEDSVGARVSDGSEPSWRLEFDYEFWPAYPHHVGRPKALAAFFRARQKAPLVEILDGLARYKSDKPPDRQWLNPANFLDDERWKDDPAPAPARQPQGRPEPPHDPIFRALVKAAQGGAGRGERPPGPDDGAIDIQPGEGAPARHSRAVPLAPDPFPR